MYCYTLENVKNLALHLRHDRGRPISPRSRHLHCKDVNNHGNGHQILAEGGIIDARLKKVFRFFDTIVILADVDKEKSIPGPL